jgi:hypothetical protein
MVNDGLPAGEKAESGGPAGPAAVQKQTEVHGS